MKLTKIVIYSRGKYRDEDGNPYLAYIAFLISNTSRTLIR